MDRNRLNLAAAVLCGIGSLASLLGALTSRNRDRGALLSGLLGTIGSAAWAAASYQDMLEAEGADLDVAVG